MAYTKKTWEDFPGTSTPITADDLNNIEDGIEANDIAISGLLDFFYPVGTIYETTSANLDTITKMANHFGGTWEAYGAGRVLVAKSADTEFDTIGETGGTKLHRHLLPIGFKNNADNIAIDSNAFVNGYVDKTTGIAWMRAAGATYYDSALNIREVKSYDDSSLQPYIVVYRYRRTA